MRLWLSQPSHTGTVFFSDCWQMAWMLLPPLTRGDIFRWMLPTHCPHSWSMIFLIRCDFGRSRVLSLWQRGERQEESIPMLPLAENARLSCGGRGRRTRRVWPEGSGTRELIQKVGVILW